MYTLILDEYGYYTTAFPKLRVKTLYQVRDIQDRWDARKQKRLLNTTVSSTEEKKRSKI